MLLNGLELKDQVKALIRDSTGEVIIVSAFFKSAVLEELSELLNNREVSIYVRWKLIDIHRGVTDFHSLYDICVKNGYKLYYNQRLHAKVLIVDRSSAVMGSSNYTNSGLGSGLENIEWNFGIRNISIDEYNRIMSSLCDSVLVNSVIIENFQKALNLQKIKIDFDDIEIPTPELFESTSNYVPEFRRKLPPFEPLSLNFSLSEHQEYLHSLGFINLPTENLLITAIKCSYYGRLILDKLHNQPMLKNRERRIRWGDVGYSDPDFFTFNDGLYNLFLWLSMISENYSFYRNPNYPKGTCSLNYFLD